MTKTASKNKSPTKRRLWLSPEEFASLTSNAGASRRTQTEKNDDGKATENDTYDSIFDQFSSKPPPQSLGTLVSNTMSLVQEFVLTCLLLAGHRAACWEELEHNRQTNEGLRGVHSGIHSTRFLASLGLIWLTLFISVFYNRFANSKKYRIQHRFTDFLLMAILLRFLSAVLKTLTASYSSDTVYALSTGTLFLHLISCDYDYANGYEDATNGKEDEETKNEMLSKSHKNHVVLERPTFQGGMLSLTSVFFATTLLASRLESNVSVYIFICCSVILFALYPAARHLVAVRAQYYGKWVPVVTSGILTVALVLLLEPEETRIVLIITSFLGIFVPLWKYNLQKHKVLLRGPWDIAHVKTS